MKVCVDVVCVCVCVHVCMCARRESVTVNLHNTGGLVGD